MHTLFYSWSTLKQKLRNIKLKRSSGCAQVLFHFVMIPSGVWCAGVCYEQQESQMKMKKKWNPTQMSFIKHRKSYRQLTSAELVFCLVCLSFCFHCRDTGPQHKPTVCFLLRQKERGKSVEQADYKMLNVVVASLALYNILTESLALCYSLYKVGYTQTLDSIHENMLTSVAVLQHLDEIKCFMNLGSLPVCTELISEYPNETEILIEL